MTSLSICASRNFPNTYQNYLTLAPRNKDHLTNSNKFVLPIKSLQNSTISLANQSMFTHQHQILVGSLKWIVTCTQTNLTPFVASFLAYNNHPIPYHINSVYVWPLVWKSNFRLRHALLFHLSYITPCSNPQYLPSHKVSLHQLLCSNTHYPYLKHIYIYLPPFGAKISGACPQWTLCYTLHLVNACTKVQPKI